MQNTRWNFRNPNYGPAHGEVGCVVPMQRAASDMTDCVTRADLDCPTLGQPYEMSKNGLPSGIDVLRCWKFLKASVEKPGIISRRHDLTWNVVGDNFEICTSGSIPTITVWSVTMRINKLIESYQKLIKSAKIYMDKSCYKTTFVLFKDEIISLFDIFQCKCNDLAKCGCVRDKNCQKMEHAFLKDKRHYRKMVKVGWIQI